jgi:magnesium-transporting ATPase (P-type)
VYFFSSIFGHKTLDPDPEPIRNRICIRIHFKCWIRIRIQWIRIHNTASHYPLLVDTPIRSRCFRWQKMKGYSFKTIYIFWFAIYFSFILWFFFHERLTSSVRSLQLSRKNIQLIITCLFIYFNILMFIHFPILKAVFRPRSCLYPNPELYMY